MKGCFIVFDARQSVDQGLQHLADRLEPLVERRLAPHLHGLPWTTILQELDRMRGKSVGTYGASDLQSQLRVITERLGALGFPFDDHTRRVSALGSELRIVRNQWAHFGEFATIDVWRSHDFVARLLQALGDEEGAETASGYRDDVLKVLFEEGNVAAPELRTDIVEGVGSIGGTVEAEFVEPEPAVLSRDSDEGTPTIGSERSVFQPWLVVAVGDPSVLDAMRTKRAKEQVRAVAVEIANFEGPIHIDRLATLTAQSFGFRKLHPDRRRKLTYQIRQSGLTVDDDKFVWPTSADPMSWREFRPSDSNANRDFEHISPVEVANAIRIVTEQNVGMTDTEVDRIVLRTFGRRKRTKRLAAHLERAYSLL